MATLREYYDSDFNYAARLGIRLTPDAGDELEGAILYDFAGFNSFLMCYVGGEKPLEFFERLIAYLDYGKTQITLNQQVGLPSANQFPGKLKLHNADIIEISAQFFGEPDWISSKQIQMSRRVFVYTETQICDADMLNLMEFGRKARGHEVRFRTINYAQERSKLEKPLAFISHDSRDKDKVARGIALGLQKMMCPVWYDEFSLNVGDNLRDKIEAGLKECKKCIVILSPNFLANGGWTKREFDSIFIREINEASALILPVWYDVSAQEVFNYCSSLQMTVGLDWNKLGQDEVCRRLAKAILNN